MELTNFSLKTMETLERHRVMALPRANITNEAPLLPHGREYHVFFSYHNESPDCHWVKAVVRELESKGYKCCVFPRDLESGKSLAKNLKNAINKSMRIVNVLSAAYIEQAWGELELEILSFGEIGHLCFIPVLIEPCDIPTSLKNSKYIKATHLKEEWWNEFLDALQWKAPRLPQRKRYHVFFAHSYSSPDIKWVENTVSQLEAPQESIVCCYPSRDFKPGTSISSNIDYALRRSLIVVLVVSKHFIANEWKKYYEGRLRQKNPIPIIISDCDLPLALDDIVCIDARSSDNGWLNALIKAIGDQGLNINDDTVTSSSQFIREEIVFSSVTDQFAYSAGIETPI